MRRFLFRRRLRTGFQPLFPLPQPSVKLSVYPLQVLDLPLLAGNHLIQGIKGILLKGEAEFQLLQAFIAHRAPFPVSHSPLSVTVTGRQPPVSTRVVSS